KIQIDEGLEWIRFLIFIFFKKESNSSFFKLYSFISDQTGRSRPAAGLTPDTYSEVSSLWQ
ncbi:MAG: hypothetical protein P8X90_35510, partial [Desulfobacterales bacterium]